MRVFCTFTQMPVCVSWEIRVELRRFLLEAVILPCRPLQMHLQQGSLLHVCRINCCLNKGKAQGITFKHTVCPAGSKEQAHEHYRLALGYAIFRSISSGQGELLNPNCNQNTLDCKIFQKYLREVKSQGRKGVSISAFLQAQNIRLLFSTRALPALA